MSCVSLGMSGIKKAKVVPTQVQSLSESHPCIRDVAIVHSLPVQVLIDIDKVEIEKVDIGKVDIDKC